LKRLYAFFLAIVALVLLSFGAYSLIDKDDEISEAENRGLAQKPKLTLASFLSG